LLKFLVHNYQLQSDLAWFLPQLKRIIWDFWGQLQSGSDLYFITGIIFSTIQLTSYMILGTIWNVIEDIQGLCQVLYLYIIRCFQSFFITSCFLC
jgi:hypothetical protein